jgi:hypothetical protein
MNQKGINIGKQLKEVQAKTHPTIKRDNVTQKSQRSMRSN